MVRTLNRSLNQAASRHSFNARAIGVFPDLECFMKIELSGVILFTENYEACVAFYRDLLGLPYVFSKPGLTCLDFGGQYLMVESHGVARPHEKQRHENPTILRFNVNDVEQTARTLRDKGIAVDVRHFEWGVIGGFTDPDGNRCELKNHEACFHRTIFQ